MVIASYRDSFLADKDIAVATARAGNVIGGGDWAADRLIPDAVRAWQCKAARCRCAARKPFALAARAGTALRLYRLAEQLWQRPMLASAYNFGPEPTKRQPCAKSCDSLATPMARGEVRLG